MQESMTCIGSSNGEIYVLLMSSVLTSVNVAMVVGSV